MTGGRYVWLLAAATAGVAAAWVGAPEGAAQGLAPNGRQLYQTHCASCHGPTGRGDGPVAEYLRVAPADLTSIAARNRGTFPAAALHRTIDGRQAVKTHGDSAMPVWGDAFSLSSGDSETAIRDRIAALVAYVESIQQRPGN